MFEFNICIFNTSKLYFKSKRNISHVSAAKTIGTVIKHVHYGYDFEKWWFISIKDNLVLIGNKMHPT